MWDGGRGFLVEGWVKGVVRFHLLLIWDRDCTMDWGMLILREYLCVYGGGEGGFD